MVSEKLKQENADAAVKNDVSGGFEGNPVDEDTKRRVTDTPKTKKKKKHSCQGMLV